MTVWPIIAQLATMVKSRQDFWIGERIYERRHDPSSQLRFAVGAAIIGTLAQTSHQCPNGSPVAMARFPVRANGG